MSTIADTAVINRDAAVADEVKIKIPQKYWNP